MNHPNIATLFELTEYDGQLLMIMELVRGDTLDRAAQLTGALPLERACRIALQVLDALGHAHSSGIVHRDLKPANVILTESGLVKVMDFGLARMIGTEHLTNDGFMVGTPAYMSPEQVLGREIDGRTDLYAMGVVLYQLLTAQLPFNANSGIAMVQKQINEKPTPVRELRADLPDAAGEILTRALAKSPDDRYQTADEFKSALMPFVGNLSSADMPLPSGIVAALSGVSAAGAAMAASPNPAPDRSSARRLPAQPAVAAPTLTPFALANAELWPATKVLPRTDPRSQTPPRSKPVPVAAVAAAVGLALLIGVPAGVIVMRRGGPPAASPAPPGPTVSPASVSASSPVPTDGRVVSEKSVVAAPPADAANGRSSLSETRARLPVVTFEPITLLEIDHDGKSHDRDASLRLGGDSVDVLDGGKSLQSVRYGELLDVFHSHSRDPRYTRAGGAAISVAKTGGPFGFLKGADDWITLRTRKTFVALRVAPEELPRLLSEFRARTGRQVVEIR